MGSFTTINKHVFSLILVLTTAFCLWGCSKGGGGSTTDGLTVQLSAAIPEGAGNTAWLVVVIPADETVEATNSTPAAQFGLLTAGVQNTPFDVTVYIPDASGWSPSDAFGAGEYARATELTDTKAKLRVSYWTRANSDSEVPPGAVPPIDQPDSEGTIAGTVTDMTGAPVEKASVLVMDQVSTLTDDMGNFTLNGVRTGTVTLTVSGAGIELWEQPGVNVQDGQTTIVDPVVNYDPNNVTLANFTGKVTDQITKAGVAGVEINFTSVHASNTLISDQDGNYSGQFPLGCGRFTLTKEDYSIRHWTCLFVVGDGQHDFVIKPLPKQFYGTWGYCKSIGLTQDRSAWQEYNHNEVDTGVGPHIMPDQTFSANGTASFEGTSTYWAGTEGSREPVGPGNWWLCHLNFDECVTGCSIGPMCMPSYHIEGEYMVQDDSWCALFKTKHYFKQGSLDGCLSQTGGDCPEAEYYEDLIGQTWPDIPPQCEVCLNDFFQCAADSCPDVYPCFTGFSMCYNECQ